MVSAPAVLEKKRQSIFSTIPLTAWLIAVAVFLIHLYFNNRYGYFRDELGYIACGDRLQWGYVDQPPLIPFLTRISQALLGDSLRAIRFVPALASSVLILQTAALVREFGGRRYAILLSAIAVALAPQYLSNGALLGTNCLEPSLWLGCAHFLVLAIKRGEPRYWLAFGVVAGIGMEEKYSIAVFGLGVVIGLLLTEHRRMFLNRWIWLGGLVAFLIFLPNLLWNIRYDWPFVQLIHAIRSEGRDVVLGPVPFFLQQTLLTGPLTAVIWVIGLFALLFSPAMRPYRVLGWCYLVCYTVFFVLHGKSYYLAPVYPMLIAAGTVKIESMLNRDEGRARHFQWLKPAIAIVPVAVGVYLAPIVVPVFSPEGFIAYAKNLPFKLPVMEHSHEHAALPQWYADQFGYKEFADEAAVAWAQIPAVERPDCGIFAQDYGQAGAIDFFGRAYGLPRALSGDRTYYLWGPRGYSGNCLIVLDDSREKLETLFNQVEYVGTSAPNPYALNQQIPVFICRGKKFESAAALWPKLKHWR